MVPLVSRLARGLLDAGQKAQRVDQVTPVLHYAIMMPLGSALIEAMKAARASSHWPIPLPPALGLVLTVMTGVVVALTVGSLALRGLGAPFAIYLSRRLAMNGMYAWTRNPMVLSMLAFLVSFGLWTRSGLFVIWAIALVTPAMLYYLKTYEERELEIRFGPSYLEYKARTPLLWPRKPRN